MIIYILILISWQMALKLGQRFKSVSILFFARFLRLFSYGLLSIIFIKNLIDKGLSTTQLSWIQSSIVFGDILVSLVLTTQADRFGRVRTLFIGALLKCLSGLVYAESSTIVILVVTGIVGVISVTGGEIGPFLPIEQSALTQLVEQCTDEPEEVSSNVAMVFGYYNMVGSFSQAFGAAFAGLFMSYGAEAFELTEQTSVTYLVRMYACIGLLKAILYCFLNKSEVEAQHPQEKKLLNITGLKPESTSTIVLLSVLFAFDAFGGAFIMQAYLSFYFERRFDLHFDKIGGVLFVCNIVAGISGVLSSKLVKKIGAMATMIYTHLPSNFLLIGIAVTSNSTIAIIFLVGRFCISQMDVPARQTYVSMVVSAPQRSAANGITNIARSVGLCIGLGINGYFMKIEPQSFWFSVPFIIAGGIKVVYDVVIGCCFLWNKKKSVKNQLKEVGNVELVEEQVSQMEESQTSQNDRE